MAGRGPTPKPNGQQLGHRTKAEKKLTVIDATDRFEAPPPLPEWCEDLCPEVELWYEAWTSSPQASRFTSTDWGRLHMLALLVDEFHRYPSRRKGLMGEIRLNESLLGATAVDRLRLRWEVKPPRETGSQLDAIRSGRPRITDPSGVLDLSESARPRVTDPQEVSK